MRLLRKPILILLIITVMASVITFGASAEPARIIAWGAANAAGDGVRIRSGPSLEHAVAAHANQGDPIVILERTSKEWNLVNYSGTIGYVSAPLLDRPRTVADFTASGKTVGSDVNMRERPDKASKSLGYYADGTVMTIIGLNEGWYKVRYDNKTGYIRSDLMDVIGLGGVPGTQDTSGSSNSSITGKLTGDKVNMRATPSTKGFVLGTYKLGTVMEVLGKDNRWYKVQHNGKTGYIYSDFMQVSSDPPDISTPGESAIPVYNATVGQKVVDLALSFTGTKYVYGGASPAGFDCSGLTSYVYKQFGIKLTRNASGQYKNDGTRISKAELKPGDLVYTSSNGSTVNHAAIYIGNNKIVHASSSNGKVIVSNLPGGGSYIGAKRVA